MTTRPSTSTTPEEAPARPLRSPELAARVRRIVDAYPPLTPAQRARIAALLAPSRPYAPRADT